MQHRFNKFQFRVLITFNIPVTILNRHHNSLLRRMNTIFVSVAYALTYI